jgi:uncharacterized membrane protein YgdD (TMEM256/DUF423 family)
MSANQWISAGALWAAIGVALGAFGAHGLEGKVDARALQWWGTGVQYHLWHALGVVAAGLFASARNVPAWPAALLLAGSAIFSGTLYAMTLGGPRMLGMVTPIGGLLMIAGWTALAWQAWRGR